MIKKEIEVLLSEKIKYATGGVGSLETNRVILKAPTTRLSSLISPLQQGLSQAVMDHAKNSRVDHNPVQQQTIKELTHLEINTMLSSSNVDLSKFKEGFYSLLLKIGLIDGKTQFTNTLIDELSTDDFDLLMGEYAANFLLPAFMRTKNS